MKKYICLFLISLIFGSLLFAATDKATEPVVSINEDTNINDALQILEIYSLKMTSKKIINLSTFSANIGVPIMGLTWRKALDLIALKNNLLVEENAGFFGLKNVASPENTQAQAEANKGITKSVRIKAVAVVADKAYMRSLGIDWSTLLNGKVNLDVGFTGAQNVAGSLFNLGASRVTGWDGQTIEVNTLLRTIESNQKGNVVAQPVLLVSSGKRGYIQVGQDISVKTTDEAGNTTDTFFATGVILDVVPTIINVDGQELVHLVLSIERSTGTPGAVSTVINKSKSSTELILYNGEETVIGGLYDTDETSSRSGIPILKDLPWWVFGIRYLTGYTKYEKKERELILLLKVDIVDDAVSRAEKAKEAKLRAESQTR